MEQTVYGDILFFVNFCMDFQCLFLTAKLLHRPFSVLRGAIFSTLGALYACVALFLSVSGIFAFLADCGVCFLMCVGAFLQKNMRLRQVFLPFALYFGVSFAVGGAMSGIASLLSHVEAPIGVGEAELSTAGFFLLALLGGFLTFLWGRVTQRRAKGKRARLMLTFSGNTVPVTCMVDTANLLRDPVGGRPVVLLDRKAAKGLLPDVLLHIVDRRDPSALGDLPHELARRVRLIPAASVTGQGMLLAVSPDQAVLNMGRGGVELDLLIAPVPLATDQSECQALLPAELIVQ